MSIDLASSWVKLKGAAGHIDRLEKAVSPLDRSFYEITNRKAQGPFVYLNPPTFYQLTYRPTEPIPETLANIIGDALVIFALRWTMLRFVLQANIKGNPCISRSLLGRIWPRIPV
ncbi:hypothetical protein [Bradyrhizobium diazoefficiens]|uniref:hypothetical protein n=1 Tax=Bradyrhizobium diazoefficiens TaxID=1355477 RepID=UPI00272A179E|nr:hypothetical protein [Bradyrhizobium diazoefficiens]WLA68835.1 hypothetical protein QNN01_20630 [Bradyrhizobium diazoefficiens]